VDILSIKPETLDIEIRHPATGAPIGLTISCVSMESDEVKAVERKIKTRALKNRGQINADILEANTIALLSAAIVGWLWAPDLTLGTLSDPPLTDANKSALLAVPWISKQIDAALGDDSAFFQQSAKTSPNASA
jgi:hypothetical protein